MYNDTLQDTRHQNKTTHQQTSSQQLNIKTRQDPPSNTRTRNQDQLTPTTANNKLTRNQNSGN